MGKTASFFLVSNIHLAKGLSISVPTAPQRRSAPLIPSMGICGFSKAENAGLGLGAARTPIAGRRETRPPGSLERAARGSRDQRHGRHDPLQRGLFIGLSQAGKYAQMAGTGRAGDRNHQKDHRPPSPAQNYDMVSSLIDDGARFYHKQGFCHVKHPGQEYEYSTPCMVCAS